MRSSSCWACIHRRQTAVGDATGQRADDAGVVDRTQAAVLKRGALGFGSQMKGTAGPDSDIDLLVEFEPDVVPGLFGIAAMGQELSALLGGRKVDLRTAQDLSRHFREEVVRTAEVQYAQ